jgi:purine-binding chemotaxis protein CheW
MNASDPDKSQERAFDWDGIREQIARASAALADVGETEPELMARTWAQRAAQLARPLVQEEKEEQIELALAQLGREVYGVEAQYILEIQPAVCITRVPRAPEWVTGVVNLRGRILSVLDLRRFFGLVPAEHKKEEELVTPLPDLIVVETADMEAALLVEDVLAIEPFPVGQIQDVTETLSGISAEYVRGVIERGAELPMVVVLNLPALLADEQLIVQQEVI